MSKEIAQLELENLKLRNENKALNKTISKLCEEINRLKNVDVQQVTNLFLSPEEEVCAVQISQLQAISRERKLTLEEVKTLDLLIKNKRLMSNKPTSNAELTLPPKKMSDDELLRIAESVQEEEASGDEQNTSN